MSVILTLPKLDIPTTLGWKHEGSSWYIATDVSFSDSSIVAKSVEDTKNLTSIVFDVTLQPDVVYYSKVRVFCNKGIIESDVDITEVKDFIKITNTHPIPSIVNRPTITFVDNKKDLPATLFDISTTAISTSSNSKHESTSYLIETLDGEAVYSKLNTKDELTRKSFNDVVLEDGRPYVLRVMHTSTSGDTSVFAEEVIVVKDVSEINISSTLDNVDVGNGFNVVLDPINNFKNMEVGLYATGLNGEEKSVYSATVNGLTKVIPNSYFTADNTNKYILRIKVTRTNNSVIGYKYFKLTTR